MSTSLKIALALGLLVLAGSAAGYAWMHPSLLRYNLTLATGPMGIEGQKLLTAFLRDLAAERPLVRLVPITTNSLAESGKALASGKVDLAVIRSDDEAAAEGRTVFILRKVGIAILLPPDSKIEDVAGLAGKKVAVVKGAYLDQRLLNVLTEFYDLRAADLIEMPLTQLGAALKARRAAAAIVFGPLGPGDIADAFAAIRKSLKEKPTFLDIAEADAIAARWPAYESVELKQGTFGGSPAEPAEDINTFAVSVRLVSRASLPDRVAGELTRLLLATKAKLVTTMPAAGGMEAPDTEKTAVLPVHAGTLAYLNGEQASLLDETLNYYWLAAMVFAVLAPLAGWVRSRRSSRRAGEIRGKVLRLVELARVSRAASAVELAATEDELRETMDWLFEKLAAGEIERDHFQCIERVISQLRADINRGIGTHSAGPERKLSAA